MIGADAAGRAGHRRVRELAGHRPVQRRHRRPPSAAAGSAPDPGQLRRRGAAPPGIFPPSPSRLLAPATGIGHGLTLTLTQHRSSTAAASAGVRPRSSGRRGHLPQPPSTASGLRPRRRGRGRARWSGRAIHWPWERRLLPGSPRSPNHTHGPATGWSTSRPLVRTLTPPGDGLYTLLAAGRGRGHTHPRRRWRGVRPAQPRARALGRPLPLTGGHAYRLHLELGAHRQADALRGVADLRSSLTARLGRRQRRIAAAVAAARRADGRRRLRRRLQLGGRIDRPSLSLPGDENALISAVAAANPRTVVVLNTGGPVLMPWLGRSRPSSRRGIRASRTAQRSRRCSTGDVDPSGRLPVTFPATDTLTRCRRTAPRWPGSRLASSTYSEGLDVGYRYDHATGTQPLFPFGYGLAYTQLSLSHLTLSRSRTASPSGCGCPTPGPGPGWRCRRPT